MYKQRKTKSTSETSQTKKAKELLDDPINLLAKGLRFIPTPVANHTQIRRQLLRDFNVCKTNAPHFTGKK